MTEIVLAFAEKWGISPFEVLRQDVDDFFLVAQHLIDAGRSAERARAESTGPKRIRVNDKTATGGWF